jgi:hypothetical protein
MLTRSFSRGTIWQCEIYEPSLPKKFALQDHFEALGLGAARERHDELHTRMLPERDWDRVLSLSRGECFCAQTSSALVIFV